MASTARNTSNTVQTLIGHAQISNVDGGFVKSVNKAYSDVGDSLIYTIVLNNTGNTTATSVTVNDTIPSGTTFVANSVTINGATQTGVNPQTGINVGNLAPSKVTTITFQVTVNTIPNINPIPNNALVGYKYTSDPSVPNGQSASNLSNTVNTQVNNGNINPNNGGFTKSADKAFADVNDIITYTLVVKNSGNVAVNNVVITDTIPNGTVLVPGSVTVNGSGSGSVSPQSGIQVGSIAAGGVATVTFQVSVLNIPVVNPIPNQGTVTYSYTVDPSNPNGKTNGASSNIANTQVNSANFNNASKTANPQYADIGSIVTYTVGLKNNGNVAASNVTFFDTIPNGTSLIANSVTINGTASPGANPANGVNVGSIASGAITTVAFKVVVNSIPNPNPILNQGTINYAYTVDPNNPNGKQGSNSTNQSSNTINSGLLNPANGSIAKTSDKDFVSIGDVITYTLKVNNVGNATINNLVITDTIPAGLTFVNGSVIVNNTSQPGGNLTSGVTIGSVAPNSSATVIFKATVNTVPASGKVVNNFVAAYNYTVNPSNPNGVSQKTVSNDDVTVVNDAVIGRGPNSFSKVSDKAFADVGDVVTYTITLSNTGNVPGNNVVLTDPIPNGTSLVPGSVTLNGNVTSQNIQTGIPIGTINPGSQAIVSFQVTVITIPNPNPAVNVASVTYTYTKDPSNPDGETVNGTSTPAKTQINNGNIPAGGFTKNPDKTVVKRGDVINYTVVIPNNGNATISNVVFTDPIPNGTSVVPNSVFVNGSVKPGANLVTGVTIGSIGPSSVSTLLFKVIVNTIPASGSITNTGTASYQYIVDPSLPAKVVTLNTNTTTIPVRDASINVTDGGFIKAVDKDFAQLNDTLTYSFNLTNTGNVTATNVVFTDTLANGAAFNNGSVIVNGAALGNEDPRTGITIPSIGPNQSVTLSFTVKVVSIPPNNLIPDTASVTFNFVQDPNKPLAQGKGISNTVVTAINSADFTGNNFLKSNDPYYVTLGDVIDYKFNINNAGNVTAQNLIFTDSIPYGLSFVPNSVVINGTASQDANPVNGINLGNVVPNTPIKLAFKALVVTLPNPNPVPNSGKLNFVVNAGSSGLIPGSANSNIVYNQVNTPNLSIRKIANQDAIAVGDTLKYSIIVSNNGNVTAVNTIINDPLASQLSYIPNSLTINGVSIPNTDIVSGVDVGDIASGKTATITFNALVVTLPDSGKVENQANANYEFIVDPKNPLVEGNTQSNVLRIPVYVANLSLNKTANVDSAKLYDVITYSVNIKNTGNITATNIIFMDSIPDELEFVPNTFYLNGNKINGVNLDKGINIGSLAPGASTTVQYDVTLVKVCCEGTATNEAFAEFNYRVSMNSPEMTKVVGPASVKIETASSTFKEFCLDGVLVVPCPKLDIEEVNDLISDIKITNYHVIKTIKGVSHENRRLTGYKLIINGVLTQTLEYTANDIVQSVHSAYFERKFSTYIILPEDFKVGTNINLNGIIEDVYYNQLNSREVFSNITILLDASILC